MGVITQDMRDIAAKATVYIFATASKDGRPNAVPIGIARIISDDEILLADNFMLKTRWNLEENPVAAVSYWSEEDRYGYQLKGKTRIETSGEEYNKTVRHMEGEKIPLKPKAVVILTVEEAYYIGGSKDSGKNLI
jgi:predicted pyridoxine 5'-phosphate oxidase superfamily flavin-nucleotide-binding protein